MSTIPPIRILMVEDNPHDKVLVEDVLRNNGLNFSSQCVDNERDFVESLDHYAPDLILSDHGMTEYEGWSALRVARQKRPEVPFIFFTSSHGEEAAIQAFKSGAADYVLKNHLADLVPAVQRALVQAKERSRRHEAEAAMRRSEESFRMLVESVKDYAIYMLDEQGRVATWNAGAERLEGYEAEEIIGRHFSVFFTPEDISVHKPEQLLKVAAEQGRAEEEAWGVRKDGSRFWSQLVYTAIRDGCGRLTGFSKVAHDMTERKRAEERLKAHICQQAVVAELGQKALWTSDIQELMNETVASVAQTCAVDFCAILELQPSRNQFLIRAGIGWNDGMVGRTTVEATPNTHSGYALQSDKPVIFENLSAETRFSGAPFLPELGIQSGLNVIIRQRERPFGVLGIYTRRQRSFSEEDIHFIQAVANVLAAANERKRAQEHLRRFNQELEHRVAQRTVQLEAANKELESFSYSVSHDLRTPLRHISGFIEMLQRNKQVKWDENSWSVLQIISDSAKKMDDLINDLLTLSRMGCSEMRQTKSNLNTMIDKVRADLRAEAAARNVVWTIPDLPPVMADPILLRQVWVNLIANALKYSRTRPESRIEIGAREEEAEWVFWVQDNGVGFEPQYAHKLFGVFQRLHPARDFEGTGIGLAIVRRIVARHGGRTWAEGAVGKGSKFYFSLPKLGTEALPV